MKRDADSLTFNGAVVKPKTKITPLMLGLMLPYMAVVMYFSFGIRSIACQLGSPISASRTCWERLVLWWYLVEKFQALRSGRAPTLRSGEGLGCGPDVCFWSSLFLCGA